MKHLGEILFCLDSQSSLNGGHPFCGHFDILSFDPPGQHSHYPGLLPGLQTSHTCVFLPHKSLVS